MFYRIALHIDVQQAG